MTEATQKSAGVFTAEQEELRDGARRFLNEKSDSEQVRALMESDEGFDEAVWKQMAELGWLGIAIPEDFGGLGYSFVEQFVLLEEMGRRLLVAPFISTCVLAAPAIELAGDDAQRRSLLTPIADGSRRAALAVTEPSGRWDADGITFRAISTGDGWTLEGKKTHVIDGHTADLLVVAARTEGRGTDGITLFTIDGTAPGVSRRALSSLDETRKYAEIDFSGARAEPLGAPGSGWAALTKVLDRAAVAIAAESIGGGQECLEMTTGYTKEREQFDRPIGSFQALQHRLADLFMEVEMARSAAYYAAWAAAEDAEELRTVAPLAKAYCTEAFFHAASECIQIHAGIGFTWEHDAHLFFKRAKTNELLLGDAAYNYEQLAQRIGI
ncbi:MAG: acyl-CoA dehydrogenase family protein [Actinomycetota bacterium]